MENKLIVANWKSNKNTTETVSWLEELKQKTENLKLNTDNFEIVICPPYIDIPVLADKLQVISYKFKVKIGAQDVSPFSDGSYTGAVSAGQLKGLVNYCLVGHSERRKYFSENTENAGKKIDLLKQNGIKPVICASEENDLPQNIGTFTTEELVIMFEPSSAISSGGVYKPVDTDEVKKVINTWKTKYGSYRYLYGGSVNPENAKQIFDAGADGFVIGKASLTVDTFIGILTNV